MEPLEKIGWISGIILAIIGVYSTLIGGIPIPYNYGVFVVAVAVLVLTAVWSFKTAKPEVVPAPPKVEVEVKYPEPTPVLAPQPIFPKIKGEIQLLGTGEYHNPEIEPPTTDWVAYSIFLSLTNETETPAYITDYEFYVDIGTGAQEAGA